DDFVFDNQMLCQIFNKGYEIGEVTCPTKYFKEASSINFKRSVIYGLGCLRTSVKYFLHRNNLVKDKIFR
ncbi:MAG: glycosyltransferase family 2 protein, partial [Leadbetterella sp.]|nr:glycosyltransferase family 2 protein [Leadbetterella sp.]